MTFVIIITNDKRHSPTEMVRLCFALLLLRKEQDGIHMPRGFMDDLEGAVIAQSILRLTHFSSLPRRSIR